MATIAKPSKRKTISQLKRETWEVFSRYIRLRDALRTTGDADYCKCITCGKLIPVKEAQAGHFIDRRHNSTLFDERNVHAQCARCNVYLDGEILKYRRELVRLYGEGIDTELEEKAMEKKRFNRTELEELKAEFKKKIKELEVIIE